MEALVKALGVLLAMVACLIAAALGFVLAGLSADAGTAGEPRAYAFSAVTWFAIAGFGAGFLYLMRTARRSIARLRSRLHRGAPPRASSA